MPWLVVTEEGEGPRVLEIAASPFRIGRRAGNDLVLSDYGASRDHSRIERDGGSWRLVDLGAANGTYLNGEKLTPLSAVVLQDGDTIDVAPLERGGLRFLFQVASVDGSQPETDDELRHTRPRRRPQPAGAKDAADES